MLELIAHNLAPIMFIIVMGMLLLGYQVALTLAAGGMFFFVVGVGLSDYSSEINLFWPLLRAMPERVFGIMSNDTLLAIPFFTFMGLILERSGMAEDLLDTVGQLFGPLRGGVAFAVIICYLIAVANRMFSLNWLSRLAETVVIVMIPPLALIFLVLGTIFLGIATPTEGGAMGAVGALLLAIAKRRMTFGMLRSAVEATAKLSAFVLFILIGARVFGHAGAFQDQPHKGKEWNRE